MARANALPGRGDPDLRLELIQRRVEGACFDLQQIFRGPLNVLRNRVAVTRSGPGTNLGSQRLRVASFILWGLPYYCKTKSTREGFYMSIGL
jgi:hypothetical protein